MIAPIPLAHGTIDGIGDIWNGILHPLREPAHLLVVLGLALLAAQRSRITPPLIAFLGASAAGLAFTLIGPRLGFNRPPDYLPCSIAGMAGVGAAARLPLSRLAITALFATGAFVIGWDSGQESTDPVALLKLLAGSWIGLAVMILNSANYASNCPKKLWIKVGFRVLGSWVAACSILYLAFTFRRV